MSHSGIVVVTGAAGFIGRALAADLARREFGVRAVVREPRSGDPPDAIALGDLALADDVALGTTLAGAFAVVHLAGRAHAMSGAADDDDAYRRANIVATERLARAAVRAHVSRLVLASSVKVSGETTAPGCPFRPDDPPAPMDAYARSKRDAEKTLFEVTRDSPTAPIVLRLPLTYGIGARGNFARLVAAVAAGQALPLGSIDNRRSLLSLGNLERAIVAVLTAPTPPSGVHFVADATSVSTPELVHAIGVALRRPARIHALPVPLLKLAGALSGRGAAVARLVSSLEVDTSSLVESTDWRPEPFGLEALDVIGETGG
jgi:nucleoside-diphosphate-sugar epimerase